MRTLDKLTIKNFKSIREQTLELGRLNIFIGANGAGKSNLLGVFRFLREIANQNLAIANQNLALHTGTKGGADRILYFGRKRSPELSFQLKFIEGVSECGYFVRLKATEEGGLLIVNRDTFFNKPDSDKEAMRVLESFQVYHFNDTSDTAAVKVSCDVEDNRALRPQAENLAAFLYWMQQKQPDHFANLEDTLRQIAPFFEEFRLAPSKLNEEKIRLEWKEKGSDAYFNAAALSDGTLRFICLATLLLQPELPPLILLDEPELGLHPAAVTLLAGLLSSAATRTQVIVATQSVTLVNQFDPNSVWAVDRQDNQSVFRHLKHADMSTWLDDYSLGELWEKNFLGARP
jgi:predicted ATPase